MEFSELIQQKRKTLYPTVHSFYNANKERLLCSNVHYSNIEAGKKIPDANLAANILTILDIPLREGLYSWVRAQMPNSDLKAMFTNFEDITLSQSQEENPSRSQVINRMQAQLLKQDPIFWELMIYIACHNQVKENSVEEISNSFKMPKEKIEEMLFELYRFGLLEREGDTYSSSEWFYIPFNEEFRPLRNQNIERALSKFLESEADSHRTTLTRLLTKEQEEEIAAKTKALQNWIIDLPDPQNGEVAKPHVVGIFLGERSFGNA